LRHGGGGAALVSFGRPRGPGLDRPMWAPAGGGVVGPPPTKTDIIGGLWGLPGRGGGRVCLFLWRDTVVRVSALGFSRSVLFFVFFGGGPRPRGAWPGGGGGAPGCCCPGAFLPPQGGAPGPRGGLGTNSGGALFVGLEGRVPALRGGAGGFRRTGNWVPRLAGWGGRLPGPGGFPWSGGAVHSCLATRRGRDGFWKKPVWCRRSPQNGPGPQKKRQKTGGVGPGAFRELLWGAAGGRRTRGERGELKKKGGAWGRVLVF